MQLGLLVWGNQPLALKHPMICSLILGSDYNRRRANAGDQSECGQYEMSLC